MGRTLRRGTALSLTLALAAQGCYPHVQLASAPPREAPSHARLGFYQAHRPVALNTQTTVMFNRYGYAGTSTSVEGVLLGNGTMVRRADDLLPIVDPDSATAQHAERSERARNVATGLLVGGLAATVAGLAMLFPALTSAADSSSGSRDAGDNALLWTSIGLSLAGSVLSLVAAYGPGATASQERISAFQALDDSLRRRLNLCERPPMIVDCATEAPAMGPPVGPAPWGAPPPTQMPAAPAAVTTPTTM